MERADRRHLGADEHRTLAPGENGSCRCTTSGSNERSASSVRLATALPDVIGAIDPFDGNRNVGPRLMIPGSGGGPSDGAKIRASTPDRRSARARPSTWSCTPPYTDSEYGHVKRHPTRALADAHATRPAPGGDASDGNVSGSGARAGHIGCIISH